MFLALVLYSFFRSAQEKKIFVLAESWVLSSLDSVSTDSVLNIRKTLEMQQSGLLELFVLKQIQCQKRKSQS